MNNKNQNQALILFAYRQLSVLDANAVCQPCPPFLPYYIGVYAIAGHLGGANRANNSWMRYIKEITQVHDSN